MAHEIGRDPEAIMRMWHAQQAKGRVTTVMLVMQTGFMVGRRRAPTVCLQC